MCKVPNQTLRYCLSFFNFNIEIIVSQMLHSYFSENAISSTRIPIQSLLNSVRSDDMADNALRFSNHQKNLTWTNLELCQLVQDMRSYCKVHRPSLNVGSKPVEECYLKFIELLNNLERVLSITDSSSECFQSYLLCNNISLTVDHTDENDSKLVYLLGKDDSASADKSCVGLSQSGCSSLEELQFSNISGDNILKAGVNLTRPYESSKRIVKPVQPQQHSQPQQFQLSNFVDTVDQEPQFLISCRGIHSDHFKSTSPSAITNWTKLYPSKFDGLFSSYPIADGEPVSVKPQYIPPDTVKTISMLIMSESCPFLLEDLPSSPFEREDVAAANDILSEPVNYSGRIIRRRKSQVIDFEYNDSIESRNSVEAMSSLSDDHLNDLFEEPVKSRYEAELRNIRDFNKSPPLKIRRFSSNTTIDELSADMVDCIVKLRDDSRLAFTLIAEIVSDGSSRILSGFQVKIAYDRAKSTVDSKLDSSSEIHLHADSVTDRPFEEHEERLLIELRQKKQARWTAIKKHFHERSIEYLQARWKEIKPAQSTTSTIYLNQKKKKKKNKSKFKMMEKSDEQDG
ncbi:hypothetical protein V1514DRAFT_323630 [Lipomyces japonicus]|uniref:uncharacterized protein n=1 Tax=Lipomyces japonicus TaxID=56871 RepID=UPI0034CF5D8C